MKDTLNMLIEKLDKIALEHCQDVGGYPDHVVMIGDYLVIAGENGENGTSLEWWSKKKAIQWWHDASKYFEEENDYWFEALNETRPEPDGAMGH